MAYLANVLLFIAFNNNRIVCSLYMCFNVLLIFLEISIQLIGIELPISDGVYSRSAIITTSICILVTIMYSW